MSRNQPTDDLDRRLDAALGALPRERAAADFTARVQGRLEPPSSSARRWYLAAAAAVLLLAATFGVREWQHRRQIDAAVQRLADLRAEYHLIAAELDSLRQKAERAQPVVYLGGDENVELVVDLARLARARQRHLRSAGSEEIPSYRRSPSAVPRQAVHGAERRPSGTL
ncbi:MAG: hypothetical protein AAGN66_01395 [Acidobacteriota bacterium]